MTEFRDIKVVAVPEIKTRSCAGCVAEQFESMTLCRETECIGRGVIFQPVSLHDGRPRLVATGGRKPSFPIKAVWFRDGRKFAHSNLNWSWEHFGEKCDILFVERKDDK